MTSIFTRLLRGGSPGNPCGKFTIKTSSWTITCLRLPGRQTAPTCHPCPPPGRCWDPVSGEHTWNRGEGEGRGRRRRSSQSEGEGLRSDACELGSSGSLHQRRQEPHTRARCERALGGQTATRADPAGKQGCVPSTTPPAGVPASQPQSHAGMSCFEGTAAVLCSGRGLQGSRGAGWRGGGALLSSNALFPGSARGPGSAGAGGEQNKGPQAPGHSPDGDGGTDPLSVLLLFWRQTGQERSQQRDSGWVCSHRDPGRQAGRGWGAEVGWGGCLGPAVHQPES